MANQYINRVIFGGNTLLDLSADTASEETVLSGQTYHDKSGAPKTGTCTFDSDTSEDTAAVAEILKGRTAHARGAKLTGTMPNNGSVKLIINDLNDKPKINTGYHDGSGYAEINAADKAKIIPSNIRQGVEVFGIIGNMTGSDSVKLTTGTATPKKEAQTILPPDGFNGFSQFKVNAIPYAESDNSAGGKTVTIG